MKFFHQMIDTANDPQGKILGRVPGSEDSIGKSLVHLADKNLRNKFFTLADQAEIFVFESTRDYIDTLKWEEFDKIPTEEIEALELDLPFQTCFFESLDGPLMYDKEEISKEDYSPSHTVGLLVHEIAPRRYEFFNLSYVPKECHPSMAAHIQKTTREMGNEMPMDEIMYVLENDLLKSQNTIWHWSSTTWKRTGLWTRLVAKLLSKIKHEEVGTDQVSQKVFYRINGERVKRKISQVIRICPHKNISSIKSIGKHSIDWSHRWGVRGHWRRLEETQLGKDRGGNQVVKGFTWVKDHVKGPEGRPMIKKEYTITERKTS